MIGKNFFARGFACGIAASDMRSMVYRGIGRALSGRNRRFPMAPFPPGSRPFGDHAEGFFYGAIEFDGMSLPVLIPRRLRQCLC